MKQAGKAHWLVIAGIASVLVVAGLFLFGKDNAGETAHRFMTALGKGDVDTLTELSYYTGESKEELRKKWEFTVDVTKHFQFMSRIVHVTKIDADNAAATMQIVRNPEAGGHEEKFQLPLVRQDGEWKVDVRAISRSMFPALPR